MDTVKGTKKVKVDPNETKEAKFRRLASTRGEKRIHQMKLLRNLGTSYAYKLDPDLAEELLIKFDKHMTELRETWTSKVDELRKTNDEISTDGSTSDTEDEPAVVTDNYDS